MVGGLYARLQGIREVAAAMRSTTTINRNRWRTRIPRTTEGALLAIADKADTIAGMFGLGLEPTGSKDPFALRRAANGIVKILAETKVPLLLKEIAELSSGSKETAAKMQSFFAERLEFYLREVKGQAYDVVKAVLGRRGGRCPRCGGEGRSRDCGSGRC